MAEALADFLAAHRTPFDTGWEVAFDVSSAILAIIAALVVWRITQVAGEDRRLPVIAATVAMLVLSATSWAKVFTTGEEDAWLRHFRLGAVDFMLVCLIWLAYLWHRDLRAIQRNAEHVEHIASEAVEVVEESRRRRDEWNLRA